jgi:hypothetical protein
MALRVTRNTHSFPVLPRGARGASDADVIRRILADAPYSIPGAADFTDDEALTAWFEIKATGTIADQGVVIQAIDPEGAMIVYDDDDYMVQDFKDGDVWGAFSGPSSRTEALKYDQQALGYGARLSQFHHQPMGSLLTDYLLFMSYGQSISNGRQSFPSITHGTVSNAKMMGDSIRPNSSLNAAWVQIGSAAFSPLVANTTLIGAGPLTVQTTLAEQALDIYTDAAEGEHPLVAGVQAMGRALLEIRADTRTVVATSTGVGGKTIEELQQGASPDLYQRTQDAVTLFKSIATGLGKTYSVAAVHYDQGQANYPSGAWARTAAEYLVQEETLFPNLLGDIKTITGQTDNPWLFITPTSGHWVRDDVNNGVTMAQIEYALATKGVTLLNPTYWVPDTGNPDSGSLNFTDHLTNNGSLWVGCQFAKVAKHVLLERKYWEPMLPLKIFARGNRVYITLNVPVPPIQFLPVYVRFTATTFEDKGIRIVDSRGFIDIAGIEIVGGCTLEVTCRRRPRTGFHVWLGDQTVHIGATNIADSDPTTLNQVYKFMTGDPADANIPALVDLDLPLNNWLVPGYWAGDYERL